MCSCPETKSGVLSRLGGSGFEENAIIKALRTKNVNLLTRLLSIEHDTRRTLSLYEEILNNKIELPLFGNARAGAWYVPQLPTRPTGVCAFKSADGHYGHWAASPRRPNLHVLRMAMVYGGVIIVDVTRKGKHIPDSLSKTVPIWCAILNVLIKCSNCLCSVTPCENCVHALDNALNVHRSVLASERAQIISQLPNFLAAWRSANMQDHALIRRARHMALPPLRPLWVQPSRPVWDDGVPLDQLAFIPIICMSASDALATDGRSLIESTSFEQCCAIQFPPRSSFPYVQGAGDDEEAWAASLTPTLFWRFRNEIIPPDISVNDSIDVITKRVKDIVTLPNADCTIVPPTPVWLSGVSIAQVPLINMSSMLSTLEGTFKTIIILGSSSFDDTEDSETHKSEVDPKTPRITYVPLTDRKGKKEYKYAFGRALGPCLSELRNCCVDNKCQALIMCTSKNGDWTAGLAIAWLVWHCSFNPLDDDRDTDVLTTEAEDIGSPLYRLSFTRKNSVPVAEKSKVHTSMMHFLSTFPRFQISRPTLKQLNRFYSSPSPSSTVQDVSP